MQLQESLTQTAGKLEYAEEERQRPGNAVRQHQPGNRRIALAQERVGIQKCPVTSNQDELSSDQTHPTQRA